MCVCTDLLGHVSVLDACVEQFEVAGEQVPLGQVMSAEETGGFITTGGGESTTFGSVRMRVTNQNADARR